MTALALLLCSLTLAAEPPPPGDPPPPPAAPAEAAAAPPGPEAAPAPERFTLGLEALVPRKPSGRLLEQPLALVVEVGRRLGGPLEGSLRFSLGYAELSRTEACALEADCWPLASVGLGVVLRATTAPDQAVVGWIGLGGGIGGAGNWDLNVVGVYGRADAGLDLAAGDMRVRLSVGWVAAAYTEDRAELEPGPQQYLAFTLAVGSRPAPPLRPGAPK